MMHRLLQLQQDLELRAANQLALVFVTILSSERLAILVAVNRH